MDNQRGILFTGNIGLGSADAVFNALGEIVGARAKRYPDGETGNRNYWIRWLDETFAAHPQIRVSDASKKLEGFKDNVERAFYVPGDDVSVAELDLGRFGYAREALSSYAKFKALRDAGTIPQATRFQVSIPTATAVLSGFIEMEARQILEAAVEAALAGEVADIAAAIPPDDLAIQFDVCYEVVGHDGGPPLHYADALEGSVTRVCRHLGYVPDGIEAGIHLCYGDPGHQHIVEPQDLGTSVAFANGICAGAPRGVGWMHMAVPRGRADEAYFAPLDGLVLSPGTELYLGLVHHGDGALGTKARIAVAEKFIQEFGVATECGFGRRPADTIPELLRIHAEAADGG